jgi:GNAT superfamily N-acetyltransferase
VALREIDSASCEMKRMFVYTQFHGKGVGRALAEAIIKEAKTLGYRTMRLDTSIRQNEAKGLYQHLGFKPIEPYYELPEDMKNWLVFMELAS